MKNGVSKVYTDRPDYADFDSPAKFEAIKSIIAKRLIEHPDAICSYSGGSDSDIMLDLIERTRAMFELPPIKYVFFNTGLEMKATSMEWKSKREDQRSTLSGLQENTEFRSYRKLCQEVCPNGKRKESLYL